MPATITLVGENNTDEAFEDAIASLNSIEIAAAEADISVADLNKELESRAAARYAQTVKEVADAWDGTTEEMAEAERQARALREEQERQSVTAQNITAVTTSFMAIKDGLEIVNNALQTGYEALGRWAEKGDAGAQQVKGAIDRAIESADQLAMSFISDGEQATWLGRVFEDLGYKLDGVISSMTGVSEIERTRNRDATETAAALRKIEEEHAKARHQQALVEEQDLDKVNKMIEQRRHLLEEIANADYSSPITREEISTLDESIRKRYEFIESLTPGQFILTEKERLNLIEELMILTQRSDEIRESNHEAEMKRITEEEAARKAAIEEETAAREKAAEEAEAQAERLYALRSESLQSLREEELARQREVEEALAKAEGREEEIHEMRMRWIEEETQAKIAAATTDEERLKAQVEGERRLRNEAHNERLRQIAEEAEAQRLAEEEAQKRAEELRQKTLEELQKSAGAVGAEGFDREAAVQQVLQARQLQARQEFMSSVEAQGLSPRELERELEEIRRRINRQTVMDARSNRLHESELARSQQMLADNAGRQAMAMQGNADVSGEIVTGMAELNRSYEALAQEFATIKEAARAQAQRARDIRRGLAG